MAVMIRIVAAALLWLMPGVSLAAPAADLWARWTAHDPASVQTIDHGSWDTLLKSYLRLDDGGIARFAYGRVAATDKGLLTGYLASLAAAPVSGLNRNEQRAFWINLYNALTVKVILDHYPVQSIRDIDISPGFFADGPWGRKLLSIEAEAVSLDDIEHRILRPLWKDPRLHYAVNCASVGCPNLQAEAFTAANSERLLAKAAREYVNHPRGATVIGGRLIVSSIYDWFRDDFGGTGEGVIAHLRAHADGDLKTKLAGVGSIEEDRYDWTLNE